MKIHILLTAAVLGLSGLTAAHATDLESERDAGSRDFAGMARAGGELSDVPALPDVREEQVPSAVPDIYVESQRTPVLEAAGADGSVHVQNVRWGQREDGTHLWDAAAIDPQQVEEVYWGQEESGVGHAFLVFSFRPGGFISERAGAAASRYLVVSVEAQLKKGQTYNPVTGEFGAFKSQVWNLSTLESFIQENVLHDKRPVGLYPFILEPRQKQMMATLALFRAVEDHGHDVYNTLGDNCTINALDVYNAVVNVRQHVHAILPLSGSLKLHAKGVVGAKIAFTTQDPTGAGLIARP